MARKCASRLLLKRANPSERRGRKVTGLREAIPRTAGLPADVAEANGGCHERRPDRIARISSGEPPLDLRP